MFVCGSEVDGTVKEHYREVRTE
eukprot:COSAG03_NODE_9802_length_692_cov_2.225970_1_plen_22_part_10